MKILLIDVYNYNKGGAETVFFNTGNMLKKHGHQVVYFTLKWLNNRPSPYSQYFPESKETRKGCFRQITNFVNYFYSFEAASKLKTLIKVERPDIAHIHLMWGQITPSIFPVLKRYNIPILYTVHDYRLVCPAYTFRNGHGKICEKCKGKYFYHCFINKCGKDNWLISFVMATEMYFRNKFFNPTKYIDGFIYVSNFAREIQEKYMPSLKNKKKVTLYNFSTSITNHPKYNYNERYFLFFGRLSYEKGVKTLIKAFANLSQDNLKIVGIGPLEVTLKNFKEKRSLENIEFLGYKYGKDLESLVKNAYFTIVPSEWYENNPMTIIESYSVGTPVIGARIGGIPEIVIDGMTGYQFESGDVDELVNIIRKVNGLPKKRYEELSLGAITFARQHLSANIYWKKLHTFYNMFIHKNNK